MEIHLEGDVFTMENPLVSVIIPVYNCEKYIERCVNSLLEQTYKNIEIIVVDDGSTDHSGAICQKYSNNNFIYVRQDNQGPSAARNRGLSLMSGEFVTFVDADDYVAPNYIQELLDLIWKYDVPIATCSYMKKRNSEAKGEGDKKNVKLVEMTLSSEDALKSLFYKREINTYSTTKLYRVSVLHHQKFSGNLRLGEDLQFIYDALKKVERIAYCNQELYYYCLNELGITHSFNCDVAQLHWQQLMAMAIDSDEQLQDAILSRMFIVAYDFLCKMPKEKTSEEFGRELLRFIDDNKIKVLLNKKNKWIVRCMALFSLFLGKGSVWVYRAAVKKLRLKKAI